MERFWDERASEDAFYFVDNRLPYRGRDLERFWADGTRDLDRMLAELGAEVRPTDTVVDVGCGVGRLTRALAERAERVLALDVSERMLALAREHNPDVRNVEWIHGDGSSLRGVRDAGADACVSAVVFQHIPDPEVTLGYVREMGRVLRPGGWAGFHVSNDPEVHRAPGRLGGIRHRLLALLGRGPRGQRDPSWLGSAVDIDRLREAAAGAGLEIERITGEGTQWCVVLARKRPE